MNIGRRGDRNAGIVYVRQGFLFTETSQPVEKVFGKLISKEGRMAASVLRELNQSAPEPTPAPTSGRTPHATDPKKRHRGPRLGKAVVPIPAS